VVGPVASLADTLGWLERRPMHGQVVAVTRARAQSSELAARLRSLGAEVIEAPAIRIEPLPVSLEAPTHDLICFTSPNGVHLFFAALPGDARSLAGRRIAAIGPGTAAALREHGIEADVVPERSLAESLLTALASDPPARALIPRAAEARDVLPDGLRALGADVEVLPLYETVAEPIDPEPLGRATYVTFTSSSTVRFFLDGGGQLGNGTRVVSIGPVTSETLREHGIEPDVEASQHDIDGLVTALLADAGRTAPA
jgi:uroporphyrinogen III methyltransferase/synthase